LECDGLKLPRVVESRPSEGKPPSGCCGMALRLGIKTNVVNMVDVAKALARPASYTTKFFGCELGAQTKFEEKSGLAIVNGAHNAAILAQMLEIFIKRFVQCFSCGNPETVVQVSKRETIHLKCKACGAVSDVDMRHKLCTFIVKNPPEKSKAADKKDKQLRRAENVGRCHVKPVFRGPNVCA